MFVSHRMIFMTFLISGEGRHPLLAAKLTHTLVNEQTIVMTMREYYYFSNTIR